MLWISQPGGWVVALTLATGLILDSLPMPPWVEPFNPDWLALILMYWCMALPHRVGVATGWLLGLLVDSGQGLLLGQHALVYGVWAFCAVKGYRQVRLFPIWQQSLIILLFLMAGRLLLSWIDGVMGYPPTDWWFFAPALSGALLWPIVLIMLRDLRRHYRIE